MKNSTEKVKIFGIIIILLSIFLFFREIYHYFVLPSYKEIPEIIDLLKYKENTYSQFFLWIIFFLLGIGLIKRNFMGWIIPQTLILIVCVFFILYAINIENFKITDFIIILGVVFTLFSILVFRYFIAKKPKSFFKIENKKMILYYLIALIITIIYWIIEYNAYSLK